MRPTAFTHTTSRVQQTRTATAYGNRVQQLCKEAEDVARRVVAQFTAQSQELERRIAEHASVTSAVLESQARKQEETFGQQQERLHATANAAQQKLTDAIENSQSELQGHLAGQVDSARAQIQMFVDAAIGKLKEGAAETAQLNAENLRAQAQQHLDGELEHRVTDLRNAANGIATEIEERIHQLSGRLHGELQERATRVEETISKAGETATELGRFAAQLGNTHQSALQGFQAGTPARRRF